MSNACFDRYLNSGTEPKGHWFRVPHGELHLDAHGSDPDLKASEKEASTALFKKSTFSLSTADGLGQEPIGKLISFIFFTLRVKTEAIEFISTIDFTVSIGREGCVP